MALNFNGITAHLFLAMLSSLALGFLCYLTWKNRLRTFVAAFEERKRPLEERLSFAKEQMAKVAKEVRVSEQRGREMDALYHVGREISKLLSRQDTLEFSREVIRDTLRGPLEAESEGDLQAQEPCFVLMLLDEDDGTFHLGTFSGLELKMAERFEKAMSDPDLAKWLGAESKPLFIAQVASRPELKAVATALPQALALSTVPLLIQSQVIGLVVIFDFGAGHLEVQNTSNLLILASQIAIGMEKAMLYDKVQRLSITDGLTGLFVHRHFQARMEDDIRRAERYKEPLGLLMLDIDFFKNYNDSYGHLAGDAVLKRVAALLKANIGNADFVARYGGEEFAVILPKQDRAAALIKAEKIRKAIEADSFDFEGVSAKVTVSIGLAAFPESAMTKKGLIDKADQALYRAKHGGRNRVEQAQGS
jgi:diguanylate cyclase (GGDEF)-like protein